MSADTIGKKLEEIKTALLEMEIPYADGEGPEHLLELARSFGYQPFPIMADLSGLTQVDAEIGILVQNSDLATDDGVYIFSVLHSGQAGFLVVCPGTVSRAPLIRKVAGDITTALQGLDLPPLTPFDLVEVASHVLANTCMKQIVEAYKIPKEYEKSFLRLYMPKFLANMGLYFTGAVKEDGSPMVYEEIVNIEPAVIWRSMREGANKNEGTDGKSGTSNSTDRGTVKQEKDKEKEKTQVS